MPSTVGLEADLWNLLLELSPPPHPRHLCILQAVGSCLQGLEARLTFTEQESARLLRQLNLHKRLRFPHRSPEKIATPRKWLSSSREQTRLGGARITETQQQPLSDSSLTWLGHGLRTKISIRAAWQGLVQTLLRVNLPTQSEDT